MHPITKKDICTKVILAESLGVRLVYCQRCEVVELELGAISIKLSPDKIQRIANLLMKASLRLDRLYPSLAGSDSHTPTSAQVLH
ncbi:MAG TPA: hypothetical protein VGD04_05470 [Methylophilus sp.]